VLRRRRVLSECWGIERVLPGAKFCEACVRREFHHSPDYVSAQSKTPRRSEDHRGVSCIAMVGEVSKSNVCRN
jgi:hypothetical protein